MVSQAGEEREGGDEYRALGRDNTPEEVLLREWTALFIALLDLQVRIKLIFQGVSGGEGQDFGLVKQTPSSRNPGSNLEGGLALLFLGEHDLTHHSHRLEVERVTPFALDKVEERKERLKKTRIERKK